ncbi:MAG: phosphotransferase family protein [Rhizobiaceae bacterium]|nr:phosphotransferase family protein [Rhizobiaceae bacterium]
MIRSNELRIRQLPIWKGGVAIAPLRGGLSNESYLVTDGAGKHVVRMGKDYPFHHVSRERELMTARAAFEAGFAPAIEHAEPGLMVTAYVDGKTFGAEDLCKDPERIGKLLRRFHQAMPKYVSGPAYLFWVFHVIRDYARTLRDGGSRMTKELDFYLSLNDELEQAQVSLPIIFGHNDLLPNNFLDDGKRLWLIDYEYAGFSTAMFDLAGAASNSGMNESQSNLLLAAYFGEKPDDALQRAYAAMQCASLLREAMWSMVSELFLSAPGADYVSYTSDNLSRMRESLTRYRERFAA